MSRKFLSLCFSLLMGLLLAQDTIRIDLSKTYQTIDNFAASDCWSMQKIGAWALPQKERVADLLFSVDKGIGLSAWRFNIGGGTNPYISHRRSGWCLSRHRGCAAGHDPAARGGEGAQ